MKRVSWKNYDFNYHSGDNEEFSLLEYNTV